MIQRRFHTRPSRYVIPLLLCVTAFAIGCGGSHHKNANTGTRASTVPPSRANMNNGITIELVPSATVQAPGGFGFAPTPVPTCGPSDLLVLVDKAHEIGR